MPTAPARGRKRPATGPSGALPPLRTLPISALVRDARLQVRKGLDPGTVATYANALAEGTELPPVRVVDVGGTLYVVDGWHRIAAVERRVTAGAGAAEVAAVVTPGMWRDAEGLAAVANLRHGLPLKAAEVRRAFNAYVRAGLHRDGCRYRSYRELAAALGGVRRHTTLRNWMRADHAKIAAAMARAYPGDEPPTNDGASWPAPDPVAHTVESARASWASVCGALAGLPVAERSALVAAMRREMDELTWVDAAADDAGALTDY